MPCLKPLQNLIIGDRLEFRRCRRGPTLSGKIHRHHRSPSRFSIVAQVNMEPWIYAGGLWSRTMAWAGSFFRSPTNILMTPLYTSYPHHGPSLPGHVFRALPVTRLIFFPETLTGKGLIHSLPRPPCHFQNLHTFRNCFRTFGKMLSRINF
jgi:hypothetical protein